MSRVLIVDDEKDVLDLAQEILEAEGHTVLSTPDGMAVPRLVSSFQPDLILLDVVLPKTSGLDILRGLRRDKQTRHIKVILFTALGTEVDIMLEKPDKADDYILKPFKNKELIEKVAKHLRG
jgi:two-component system, OmpR family, phosphate regulon response regulator PhoB